VPIRKTNVRTSFHCPCNAKNCSIYTDGDINENRCLIFLGTPCTYISALQCTCGNPVTLLPPQPTFLEARTSLESCPSVTQSLTHSVTLIHNRSSSSFSSSYGSSSSPDSSSSSSSTSFSSSSSSSSDMLKVETNYQVKIFTYSEN
jgi:hypothetical protein